MLETKLKIKKYCIGEVYYVDFGDTISPEINNVHMSILFPSKICNNMIFCLPFTSPKLKHFKDRVSYEKRDTKKLKYKHIILKILIQWLY